MIPQIPGYRVPSNSTVGAGFHARPPEIVCNFRIPEGNIAYGDVTLFYKITLFKSKPVDFSGALWDNKVERW